MMKGERTGIIMSCKECEYSPKTYEEYRLSQSNPGCGICPDAYTDIAQYCGNYDKCISGKEKNTNECQ